MKYVVNNKESKSESESEKAPLLPSCRLTLALMTFLSLTVLGLLRSNLTVSLVCMVRTKQPSLLNATSIDLNFTAETTVASNWSMTSSLPSDVYKGEFSWSRQYQGFLLSAYFYGYLATQLLSGFLTGRFGAKYVLMGSVLVAAAATLLTPMAARFNIYLLAVLRSIVGCGTKTRRTKWTQSGIAVVPVHLFLLSSFGPFFQLRISPWLIVSRSLHHLQGFIYPAAQSLWGIWAPPLERSILSSFTFIGLNVGYMLTFLISSECCQIPYDNGWPISFYITGCATVLFCVLWNFLVFSSPDQHPRISDKELNYIKSTTGLKSLSSKERKPFPWSKVARSPAVISLLIVQTSHTWFSYAQTTTVPLYFRDVLRFDIKQNGLFMILPYLLVLLTSPPLAYVADLLRVKKVLSTANVRKLFQSISSFGSVILIIIIGFLDYEDRYVAVSLLIFMSVVNNVGRYGFLINPQDIAPRYSGEIFGIVNTAASLSGILAPLAVGQLTTNGTLNEWRSIFYMSAAFFFVGGLVFAIFAKGEPLPWAKDDDVTMTLEVTSSNDIAISVVKAKDDVDEDPELNASATQMSPYAAQNPTFDDREEQMHETRQQQREEEERDNDSTERF